MFGLLVLLLVTTVRFSAAYPAPEKRPQATQTQTTSLSEHPKHTTFLVLLTLNTLPHMRHYSGIYIKEDGLSLIFLLTQITRPCL